MICTNRFETEHKSAARGMGCEISPAESGAPTDGGDEVLALTWAVLDGVATEHEKERLTRLIDSAYENRSKYVRALEMSQNLEQIYGAGKPRFSAQRRTNC